MEDKQPFQQTVLEKLGIHVERAQGRSQVQACNIYYSGGWKQQAYEFWTNLAHTQRPPMENKQANKTVTKDESWIWKQNVKAIKYLKSK